MAVGCRCGTSCAGLPSYFPCKSQVLHSLTRVALIGSHRQRAEMDTGNKQVVKNLGLSKNDIKAFTSVPVLSSRTACLTMTHQKDELVFFCVELKRVCVINDSVTAFVQVGLS